MSNNNSQPVPKADNSHRFIIRSTSILSLGTLSSRILGFVRDVILARLLGTGAGADAFYVALRIPNLFRELVAEGATNSAVVPVMSEYAQKQTKEELNRFINVILALAFIILSLITILGIIFAPLIVRCIAPGFSDDPEKFLLTVKLTKLLFPYLIFIGLAAHAMAILYTNRSFLVPAFSPCLLNIAVIVSAFFISERSPDPTFILALGVLAGGVLQLAVYVVPILKTGVIFKMPNTLNHPGAVQVGKLLVPRILGGGVYQMNIFIDTICASLTQIVGAGGVSAIYYANRIIQFPMGVFSVALASAALPAFSNFSSQKDMASFRKTLLFAVENILFIMCPTGIILMLMSKPLIRTLFERGEFDAYSTGVTSTALAFTALGLFSFGAVKILVTAFYALQDTKTPLKVAFLSLFINGFLNLILMGPLQVGGIALASTIAGTINFLALLYLLERRLGKLFLPLREFFIKVSGVGLLTGILEYYAWRYFVMENEFLKLCLIGAVGFLFYWIVCLLLKIKQAEAVWDTLNKLKWARSK